MATASKKTARAGRGTSKQKETNEIERLRKRVAELEGQSVESKIQAAAEETNAFFEGLSSKYGLRPVLSIQFAPIENNNP